MPVCLVFPLFYFSPHSRLLGFKPVLQLQACDASPPPPRLPSCSHGFPRQRVVPRSLRRIPRHSPRSLLLARRTSGVPNLVASVTSDPRNSRSLRALFVSCIFCLNEQLLNRLQALIASPFYRLVVWVALGISLHRPGFVSGIIFWSQINVTRNRIVSQFKDNVSQCKIASTHNIVKRFMESGKSRCVKTKGVNRWRYCLRNRHATMMDIATLVREDFGKMIVTQHSLPLHQEMQVEIVLYIWCRNATSSWAQSHLRWTERQWKRVVWSDKSTFSACFLENGHWILRAKEEKGHPDCYQLKV